MPTPQAPEPLPQAPPVIGAPAGAEPAEGQASAVPESPPSPVLVSLLTQSRQAAGRGELARAAELIERGLRIEPDNARLWSRLAQIRLEQGRFSQAESLARKSNRFAQGRADLLEANWRLIARARSQRGDEAGAEQARQTAAHYQAR